MARHQNELENVISMLSKFERSRRGEESMSMTISRSYIDGATGLGPNSKQPQGGGPAIDTDASVRNLRAGIASMKKADKHLASQ